MLYIYTGILKYVCVCVDVHNDVCECKGGGGVMLIDVHTTATTGAHINFITFRSIPDLHVIVINRGDFVLHQI